MKMFNDFILSFQIFLSKNIIFNVFIMCRFIILKYNILFFIICINKITNTSIELSTILCMLNIPTMFFSNLFKHWN